MTRPAPIVPPLHEMQIEANPQPFRTAEAAWLWAMRALMARRQNQTYEPGPCEPDEIVRHLNRLYRQRQIDLVHARVLRIWGERQRAPKHSMLASGQADCRIWREALERLEIRLRNGGIVR
jgi:hypothetical protein